MGLSRRRFFMTDGSVHFFLDSMDLRILGRLATRAGGEVINAGDF